MAPPVAEFRRCYHDIFGRSTADPRARGLAKELLRQSIAHVDKYMPEATAVSFTSRTSKTGNALSVRDVIKTVELAQEYNRFVHTQAHRL